MAGQDDYVDQILPMVRRAEGSADDAVSPAGAIGRYQIMPSTARALGFDPSQLKDPAYNETAARAAIRDLVRQHGQDTKAVLAGYNASPNAVRRWKNAGRDDAVLPEETQHYFARAGLPSEPKELPYKPIEGPAGKQEYQRLLDGGFTQDEANQWAGQTADKLRNGGFSEREVADYFGEVPAYTKPQEKLAKQQVDAITPGDHPKIAQDWTQSLTAGLQSGVLGLAVRGQEPSITNPEKAGLAQNLAFQGGQMISDLPAMVAGFVIGGAGGAAEGAPVGPEAAVVTGGFGAWAGSAALPEAVRGALLDSYRNPNGHKTWSEWSQEYGRIAFDTLKAGLAGGIGGRVGGIASSKVAAAGGKELAQTATFAAAQLPASIAASSAMEGRVPDANDFLAGAVLTVGTGLAGHVVGSARRFIPSKATEDVNLNLGDIYKDLGIHPADAVEAAAADVSLKAELISRNADGTMETPGFTEGRPAEPMPDVLSSDVRKMNRGLDRKEEAEDTELGIRPWSELRPKAEPDPATEKIEPEKSVSYALKEIGEHDPEMPPAEENLTDIQKAIGGKVLTEVSHGKYEFDGPEGEVIGSYLRKFGDLAGFAFKLTKGENVKAEKGGASFTMDAKGRHTVDIPVTEQELTRRWYGLGRYEIIHHEVGHAIDLAETKYEDRRAGKKGWLSYAIEHNEVLKAEATEMSKGFRPKIWEMSPKYTLKPVELAADALARYMSDPTIRGQYPEFEKFAGEKLKPYLAAAEKALPTKSDGKWAGSGDEQAAAGGGGGALVPPGTIFQGGEKPEPLRIGHQMPLEEANGIVDNFIGEKPTQPRPWWNPKVVYRQFFTELANSRALDKELSSDPKKAGVEDMLRQTYGSAGRAGYFVRYGTLKLGRDPRTRDIVYNEQAGASLMSAFEKARELGGTQDGFVRYLVAARALMLDARGINSGLDSVAAKRVIEETNQVYHPAMKIWQENNFAVVDYARDSGVFSAKKAAAMKLLNPFHVVFNRVVDPSYAPNNGRGFGTRFPVKKIQGSDRQIIPPIPAQVDNMHHMIAMADRNIAVGHVLRAFDMIEQKLPSEQRSMVLKDRWDVAKLRDEYLALPAPERTGEDGHVLGEKEADAVLPMFAQRKFFGSRGPNDFLYFNEGKPEIWTAKDPETALMLRATQPQGETNAVTKIAEGFANISRLGIVSLPDFPLRTTIRSQFEAALRSDYVGVPGHAWLQGIWHVFGQDKLYQQFMKDGGFGAAVVDIDEKYIQRDVAKIFEKTGAWDRTWNTFRHPLEALHSYRQMIENAARLGAWSNAKEAGLSGGKAAMESRRAFGDAAERAGLSWVNTWAKTTVFMRPSVLDVTYLFQAMRDRPIKTIMAGTTLVTLPTIGMYIANKMYDEDKENNPQYRAAHPEYIPYSELPRWQKDMMLIAPPMNGVRMRFPSIPYTGGFLFHTLVSRFLDYAFDHDPRAFKDWGNTFMAQFVPPFIPALALPMYEAATNTRQGTGGPLVPESLERVSPDMRYTKNTSEVAKGLAKAMGEVGSDMTPISVDNYIREWGGPIPSNAIRALDGTMAKSNQPWELSDIPIVGMFIARHPDMNTQPIEDFYRQLDTFEQKHADIALAIRNQDFTALPQVLKDPRGLASITQITKLSQAMSKQSMVIRNMDTSKMTNAEKQKYMDASYSQINEMAKAGLKVLDSVPETFK